MIKLGDEVQDLITGFQGIATARIIYITGCVRYEVTPEGLEKGNMIEPQWVDERTLKVIRKAKVKIKEKPLSGPGNTPPKFKSR